MGFRTTYEAYYTDPEIVRAKCVFFPEEEAIKERFIPHVHNRYEMIMITKGHCSFLVHNYVCHLEENDICLIPPEQVHSIFCLETAHEHIFLNFTDFYIDRDMAFDVRQLWHKGKYTPKPKDVVFIQNLFRDISENEEGGSRYHANYLKTCFDRIFIQMLRTPEQFEGRSGEKSLR